MENRKAELLDFINYVPEGHYIGIYYLDKILGIKHYSVYAYDDFDVLRGKLEAFDALLDDALIKIILWKESESQEYLKGVYDGVQDAGEVELS